jgi:phosphonate transport system substrate-binding protein
MGACADDDTTTEPSVVVSIVEVPGEPVTSIVTETSIVEIPASTTADPRANWPKTLVFDLAVDAQTDQFADTIEAFTTAIGEALEIRVVVRPNPDEAAILKAVAEGRSDIASLLPTTLVGSEDRESVELFGQWVRFGDSTYHSQWFTNDPAICGSDPVEGAFYYDDNGQVVAVGPTDSPALQVGWTADGSRDEAVLAGLACPAPVDLDVVIGKTIAFAHETSTVGFIYPVSHLRQEGIANTQYTSTLATGHTAVVEAVYNGSAEIGVSFDDARRILQETNPDVGTKVIVFNITPPVANDVLVIRPGFPDSFKDALFEALWQYMGTLDARLVMSDLFGWDDLQRADARTSQSLDTVANAVRDLGLDG